MEEKFETTSPPRMQKKKTRFKEMINIGVRGLKNNL